MPHGGDVIHGGGPVGAHARPYQPSRASGRWYGAQETGRNAPADRAVHAQRASHAGYGGGDGAYGAYGSSPRMAVEAQERVWRPDDGMRYAGAITPVSAEGHVAPHPPVNATMIRAGSIRADVARYNEERGAARSIPRPPDDVPRPPVPSPYRN